MRYANDLTSSVEAYIKKTLVEKIMKANNSFSLCNTAQEMKEYLCDNSTINTSDFVLRRYIYKYHPELFDGIENYEKLCENFRYRWPDDILKQVAKNLSDISKKKHGLKLSTTTWSNYLIGQKVRRSRVFEIAFVLQMDVETTLELLLAYNMEPYSVRNPIELICIFCQKEPNKYTWKDVEDIFKCFEERVKEKIVEEQKPTVGKTQIIENELDKIFKSNLPDDDTKQMLIQYMIENANEFKSFTIKSKKVYLPGYSLTRMNKFMKLMRYLVILYPTYEELVEAEAKDTNKASTKRNICEVKSDNDGYPMLKDLKKAMFQAHDWNFNYWEVSKKETSEKNFQDDMDLFCKNYEQHIWAINRLREEGDNVAFFERKDALLFAYFLIDGYLKLVEENDSYKNKQIETLLMNGDEFDKQLGIIFESLECLDDNDSLQKYDTVWQCINIILKEMDYPILYVPSAFDRFIVLSLMSVSPEELTPLILNEANLEDYENTEMITDLDASDE